MDEAAELEGTTDRERQEIRRSLKGLEPLRQ